MSDFNNKIISNNYNQRWSELRSLWFYLCYFNTNNYKNRNKKIIKKIIKKRKL